MRDHEKTSYLDFNQTRLANLQQQLLRTRDAINKAQLLVEGAEDLGMLKQREATLLGKIAEIKIEPVKVNPNIDAEYSSLISVVPFIGCDICQNSIEFGVVRYHCTEQNNFDICQKCFAKGNYPHPTFPEKYDDDSHQKRIAKASSIAEIMFLSFQCFLERPCLGQKKGDVFEWISYKEVFNKSMSIGAGLRSQLGLEVRDSVAIHSRNSFEWIFSDLACLMHGFVVVPIHHVERDPDSLSYILNNCNIKSVFCEEESAELFLKLKSTTCPNLQHIVVYPSSATSTIQNWTGLIRYGDIEASGSTQKFNFYPLNPTDIVSIIHTSGSTGKPKGAPFTDKSARDNLIGSNIHYDPHVSICFEPLAHVSEREFLHEVLTSGGRSAIINITNNLFEDIAHVGPCSLSSTPRFWNVLHSKYQQTLVLEQSLSSSKSPEVVKKEVLARFKTILGSRLKSIGCGGAAPSQQLLQFLTECYGENAVSDGYGSTEAGSIAGKKGFIVTGVKIKLVDVPELGYFSTDLPHPRGELYVQTKSLISGYYNNPEDTARLFVDGWFCTGDIVELLGERQIKIIDRRKNFFKLSQGEYVAAEKLENRYLLSPFVDQIFITCGDITRFEQNSVFAVIVPHLHLLQKWAADNGIHQSDRELCSNPRVKEMIIQNLKIIARSSSLTPYEIPGNVILEPEMFTVENAKMTSSNKLARPILERFYKDRINGILEEQSKEREQNSLWKILSEIIGEKLAENAQEDKNKSLSDIGGDSLSAVRLSSVLNSKLNVEIPPHVLLDKNTTLESLSQFIANANKTNSSVSFSSSASLQLADEITKDLDLISSVSSRDSDINPTAESGKTVLITGATGFVGAHLVKQILKEKPDSQVTCLVRNTSQFTSAELRLKHVLQRFQIWQDIEADVGRLSVLAGDFGKDNFGLEEKEYSKLLETVDTIFHCGAVVNHVLSYSAMRNENVIGTKNVIEFSLKSSHSARLNFVSTISCIPNISSSASPKEELDYVVQKMGGYEQSKYVSEKLVQKSFDKKIIRGSILRLGMVGWNSISGVGNPNDWLFILFSGIMKMGKAPDSKSEFEMLPVDVVCHVLSLLGFSPDSFGSTIDICGNNLVPFKTVVKHIEVETEPFQQWKTNLLDKIEKHDLPKHDKKVLEGLLLFSVGLPDDREHKKEIIERSKSVSVHFDFVTYDESVVKNYLEYVKSHSNK